jgi:DNA-binding MarR family transcriptional regulator
MYPADDLTLGKRMLLHLSQYFRYQQEAVCPFGMTQDGIAETLGIRTGNVSVQLSRLMKEGCVERKVAHVEGMKTRRKVYLNTLKGQRIAESFKERGRNKAEKGAEILGQVSKQPAGESGLGIACETIEIETTVSAASYSVSFLING